MPQYRVNYFDVRGLAEVARLILAQAGQEFVDHRFSREQWPEEKTNSKFLKFFKLQYHFHITEIQSYVSLKLGNVQLAVRFTA